MFDLEKLNDAEFESYLAAKYGSNCYGLRALAQQAARQQVAPTIAAEPTVTMTAMPTTATVTISDDDLHRYGSRWAAGEKISALAKEIGSLSWNKLHTELTKLGYKAGQAA